MISKVSFTETLRYYKFSDTFSLQPSIFDPATSRLIKKILMQNHQKNSLMLSLIAELSYITEMLSCRATKKPPISYST